MAVDGLGFIASCPVREPACHFFYHPTDRPFHLSGRRTVSSHVHLDGEVWAPPMAVADPHPCRRLTS